MQELLVANFCGQRMVREVIMQVLESFVKAGNFFGKVLQPRRSEMPATQRFMVPGAQVIGNICILPVLLRKPRICVSPKVNGLTTLASPAEGNSKSFLASWPPLAGDPR